jgi:hypothetical protein
MLVATKQGRAVPTKRSQLAELAHAVLADPEQAIPSKRKSASSATWLARLGSRRSRPSMGSEFRSLTDAATISTPADRPTAVLIGQLDHAARQGGGCRFSGTRQFR